jgi:4-aminobutyrate aminotransferase-like enzyme
MLPALITEIPGPRSLELAARLSRVECRNTTFSSPDWPIFWERADGSNIWDADGNRFLDLTSAFGVATLGHGSTADSLRHQSTSLLHAMGDVHPARLKVELCEKLSDLTFQRWTRQPGKTLLGNSGFEAVEAALKTAVLATGKSGIAAFQGGYHGLGYGALLGNGIPWFREPFAPQLANVSTLLPYPRIHQESSIQSFRESLTRLNPATTAAILVEPFQGRGGIVVPHPSFLSELRAWCDAHHALLILDEIYTGFLRTGPLFACEHSAVVPDLICLGKALTGGFPLSACVGKPEIMDAWPTSNGEALHTSTFLGNPLGCAMAIDSLNHLSSPETAARASTTAAHLATALSSLHGLPFVHEIRGPGLMKGIELRHPNGQPAGNIVISLVTQLLKKGLILLPDGPLGDVIALTPPITVTPEEIDHSTQLIASTLTQLA